MTGHDPYGRTPADTGVPPPPALEPALVPHGRSVPGVPRRRWWRPIIFGLPIAAVLAVVVAFGLYLYTLSRITVGTGEAVGRGQGTQTFGWPLRLVNRVNILLIGIDVTIDNRRQITNVARADSLLLLSFDPERRRISVISIPRDTRAQIPGFGETKINASYAYGGPRLTIKTVERLLAVRVNHHIKLGADSFANLVDAVGGVEVDVEKDMKYTDSWAGYTIDLKKGRQRLNGQQATGYIRFRYDALGDIGRVQRQHKVMLTLVKQMRQPSTILAGPQLLRAFAENTQSDLTPAELATLGLFALRTKEAPLRIETLPGGFAPQYWEPDTPRIRTMVADVIYGVSPDELTRTVVEVVNASGASGAGRRVAGRIAASGFRTVRVRVATTPVAKTVIIDRGERARVARMVSAVIGNPSIRRAPGTGATITVIVGRNYARAPSASRNGL